MCGGNGVFRFERTPWVVLELKLIHFLKLWPADNVNSWESFVEKEHPR